MAFYRDAPSVLTNVQWYFADPRADQLYKETLFYSRLYDIGEFTPDALGERYEPRSYKKGKPPYPVSFGGLCGSDEQWRIGPSAMDPLPPRWPSSDVPKCCSPPPDDERGVVIGFPASLQKKLHACTVFDFIGTPPIAFTFTLSHPLTVFPPDFIGNWGGVLGGSFTWNQTPTAFHFASAVYECDGSDFRCTMSIGATGFPFPPDFIGNRFPDSIDVSVPSMTWHVNYTGYADIPPWVGDVVCTWTY